MSGLIAGIGTDIVNVDRIKQAARRGGDKFLRRLFTGREQDYCAKGKNPFPCYAARFAAKEAVLKALGSGLAGCRFTDVEIRRGEKGPQVKLYGGALARARAIGVSTVLISISHEKTYAVAFATALKEKVQL